MPLDVCDNAISFPILKIEMEIPQATKKILV